MNETLLVGEGLTLAATKVGMRVIRGHDWRYRFEDEIPPGKGTVTEIQNRRVQVLWDSGLSCEYVIGYRRIFFLKLAEPFPAQQSGEGSASSVEVGVQVNKNNKMDEVAISKGHERLIHDFGKMFSQSEHNDTVLKVEDREFSAHRAILAARSPVFASMFKHHTKESISGIVNIPDCSAKAFEVFLNYLYTGRAEICCDIMCNLYYTADKYYILELKEDCIAFMRNSLSVDTFCEVIALSLLYNESELRSEAISFFCKNVGIIIETVPWQKYIQENPLQCNELYIKAIKGLKSGLVLV